MSKKNSDDSIESKHSATGALGGFFFQIDYFIYRLLLFKKNEKLSFEKYDDVASKKEGALTYYQVKHTIYASSGVGGSAKKLTDRSTDLWKAITLWIEYVLYENPQKKRTISEQKTFLKDHDFIFVTNKKTDDNQLLQLCAKLGEANQKIAESEIDLVLDSITKKSKNSSKGSDDKKDSNKFSVQDCINTLKGLKWKRLFLSKIKSESCTSEDLERMGKENLITENKINPNAVDATWHDFRHEVIEDISRLSKTGETLEYSYDQYIQRFQRVYDKNREFKIDFPIVDECFRKEFNDFVCIKQLECINDFDANDTIKITKISNHFLRFKNKYESLLENSEILVDEGNDFLKNTCSKWENEFEHHYDGLKKCTDDSKIIKAAKNILYETRKFNLHFINQDLDTNLSNGVFYYLSDRCEIGWHRDWEKMFKLKQK